MNTPRKTGEKQRRNEAKNAHSVFDESGGCSLQLVKLHDGTEIYIGSSWPRPRG